MSYFDTQRREPLPRLRYCTRCEGKWLLYADGRCPECDKEPVEPFKVEQSVMWYWGKEQGTTVMPGKIVEVKGPVLTGTLICEFPGDRKAEFYKKHGKAVTAGGFIRFPS